MKIKSIAALCAAQDKVILIDRTGGQGQWVSDGIGAYPLEGLPYMEMEQMLNVFDFNEKKRAKVETNHLREEDLRISLEDEAAGDEALDRAPIAVGPEGNVWPVYSSRGLLFLDTAHIKPIKDALPYATFLLRIDGAGQPYVAVRTGMVEICAALCPVVNHELRFAQELEAMLEQLRIARAQGWINGIVEINGAPVNGIEGTGAYGQTSLLDEPTEEDEEASEERSPLEG